MEEGYIYICICIGSRGYKIHRDHIGIILPSPLLTTSKLRGPLRFLAGSP